MLYHVAPLKDLQSIVDEGLQPGRGGKFGMSYGRHSRGKIFFTCARGARFWWDRIAAALEQQTDNPQDGWIPVMLRMDADEEDFAVDVPGTTDAKAPAVYDDSAVPPEFLEVWDGSEWVPLDEMDEDDVDVMVQACLDDADVEFVDGDELYYVNDMLFWPGPQNLEE